MTLSEQERASSSRRANGHDETETGPYTAALPTLDTAAFGATRLDTAAFRRAGDPAPATSWFGAGEFADGSHSDGSHSEGSHSDAGFSDGGFSDAGFTDDEMPEDPEISELTEGPDVTDGPVFAELPGTPESGEADDADITSTMAPFDAAEVTSTMAPFHPAEITSAIPPVGWPMPTETTSVIPPLDAAEVTTAIPPAVGPAEATEVVAPTPMMVVGSRGVRRASPSAAGPVPAATTPPATPRRTGLLGLFSGPQGVVMRLLLVLLLLAGVVGTVVVTDPHVLTGFKTSPDAADGPLTTLAPAAPVAGGLVPPGGLMPGMPLMPAPMAPPLGAPPPGLPPGPLGGPGALPGAPLAPGLVPRTGGIGVGDVLGALFDSGKGNFASHFDNSGGDGLIEAGYYPSVVPNPQFPGRQAFQMALGPGGKRSEVLPVGPGTQPVDGEQQFVRYSAILGPNFPVYTDGFQLIMQWHHQSNDGSPPLALQVNRGVLNMVGGGDNVAVIGPVAPGQPINLTMQIRFSSNPGLGAVSVWRDGRPVIVDWHPVRGTMFTPSAYLKMGMYRSQSIMQGGAVTITDLKIGQTPDSIGGLGPLAPR